MSRDRIGIVAEVSGAIAGLGGDIADLRQSVLRDYFTMMLLATFPTPVSPESLRQRITEASAGSPVPLEITVRPVDATPAALTAVQNTYLLTARGPDRIGFVESVSRFCAANQVNILDLATVVAGDQYVMMLLVDVSACADLDALRRRLKEFGLNAGVQAVLQHETIFRATNEVDYDTL